MSTAERLSVVTPTQLKLVEDPLPSAQMREVIALMAWVLGHVPERINKHSEVDLFLQDFQAAFRQKTPETAPSGRMR